MDSFLETSAKLSTALAESGRELRDNSCCYKVIGSTKAQRPGEREMLWVGLSGGIACGKSTVAKVLRSRGFTVIDADILARDVVRSGTAAHAEIVQIFGTDSVSVDGELNRSKVAALVFANRELLAKLESIIHPLVRRQTEILKQALQARGESLAFYDVPLLFEKKMQGLFDQIVVVSCAPELQISRLMARNQLTETEASNRIAAQLPLREKIAGADHVIENNGDTSALEHSVDSLLEALLPRPDKS